jgi:hypothetical protein
MGVVCNESETDLEWVKEELRGDWGIGGEYVDLPLRIQREYGFCSPGGVRSDCEFVKIKGQNYTSLMSANDNGVSFDDLADYIEENYKYL